VLTVGTSWVLAVCAAGGAGIIVGDAVGVGRVPSIAATAHPTNVQHITA
jgi:hypothetical protein